MLLSCALILLIGYFFGEIFKKIKLPSLVGMLLAGILLGPCFLNLIDDSMLLISSNVRKIALVIILTRAGFNLKIEDLKKVGASAFLMCFLPACAEIIGMVLLAPRLLGLNLIDSLVLGSVIAAVSPAVIVPKMVKLIDEHKGCDKSIPQLILAGASVDDVFVIALFTMVTSLASEGEFSYMTLLDVPISIILGILGGIFIGMLLSILFKKVNFDSLIQAMIVLGSSFILVSIE
ncbi:MAG: cation:proton antiporter, partial [Traorella sp.]